LDERPSGEVKRMETLMAEALAKAQETKLMGRNFSGECNFLPFVMQEEQEDKVVI
jgi:hypothetical protein